MHEDPFRARAIGWLCALLLVVLGSFLRIHAALGDPNFDAANPEGMLKSDPGLLYYFTGRILAAHGSPPGDFRADPRVEHPEATDVPATFAVGQEFAVAWGYLLFGRGMPLHVFCVWIMGIWASLAALAVYALAAEISGSALWAVLAAVLYSAMPANYRTVGWILMNEDFSVPWFALHLWLLARAARVRTPVSILLASIPLGVAVSTWHAMSFFISLEAVCVFAWFLRTGRNPLAARGAWILPVTLLAFSVGVPVLRSTVFALSLPMQVVLALWAAAIWKGTGARFVALVAWAFALAASISWSRLSGGGIGEYGHVFALMWEKVSHLGRLPEDPGALPVEVRLMWQGPFGTLDPVEGLRLLGLGILPLVPAGWAVVRAARSSDLRGGDERRILACALACLSIPVAWLVERTVLLPGLLLPVVGAAVASRPVTSRFIARGLVPGLACAAGLVQGWYCVDRIEGRLISWYLPPQRQAEIAELVAQVPHLVPEGEAIAADFMNSTAILAHTGHPIVFQPKWETKRSRERAAEFLSVFFHGTPDEMRRLLLGKYRCRYVVFDRFTLGILHVSRYVAGIPVTRAAPERGTCAAFFLSQDAGILTGVPGYKLLYRSPPRIRQSDGSPADFFRLYELEP